MPRTWKGDEEEINGSHKTTSCFIPSPLHFPFCLNRWIQLPIGGPHFQETVLLLPHHNLRAWMHACNCLVGVFLARPLCCSRSDHYKHPLLTFPCSAIVYLQNNDPSSDNDLIYSIPYKKSWSFSVKRFWSDGEDNLIILVTKPGYFSQGCPRSDHSSNHVNTNSFHQQLITTRGLHKSNRCLAGEFKLALNLL